LARDSALLIDIDPLIDAALLVLFPPFFGPLLFPWSPVASAWPANMMAQMMQMKSAQEGSQLNALKLQQAQREVEQQNMLGQAYQSAFDPQTGKVDYSKLTSQLAGAGAGAQIPGILKGQRELESADVDAKTKKVKLLTDTLSTVPEMYKMASTPDDFLAVHQYVHSDPVLGPWLKSIGATPEKGLATLQAASQTPEGLSQYKNQAMSSVNQILESSKPLVVAPSASVFVGGKFQQAPSAPSGPIKPPEKIEIMRALGYPLDAAGKSLFDICLGVVQQRNNLIGKVRGILRGMSLCHS
jgi:hypothetical protein